ncbi:hypothetical protein COLO4_38521 [Corchorus olitorius]|uniref:Uncharacterized protein n=1 Tax=Corchorus olitorius TaxID=93759 RepID=A0A1R3FUG5_9ROSI|nr:hypothetical protein COLO4_38521 [Corchorus olitorius]
MSEFEIKAEKDLSEVVLVATPNSGGKVNRDPPVIGESETIGLV